jgi:thiaminase/transcriptional activator TenA
MQEFARLLDITLHTEMEMHRTYCKEFGITPDELEQTAFMPTTYAYTRHLISIAAAGTLAETIAALLPCAWGYCEIARKLVEKNNKAAEHPLYGKWIATYNSDEFWQYVGWLKQLLDDLSQNLSDDELLILERHFIISSRYEYLFWEMAYTGEQWPV